MSTCVALLFAISLHVGDVHDVNEVHPTAGVACDSWSAGGYYNSDSKLSTWAAYRWSGDAMFAEIGAVTGYQKAAVLPMVRAGVSLPGVEIFAAPGISKNGDPLLVLSAVMTWSLQ